MRQRARGDRAAVPRGARRRRRARAAAGCPMTACTPGTCSRSACGSSACRSTATPFIEELKRARRRLLGALAAAAPAPVLHGRPSAGGPRTVPAATAVWQRLDQPADLSGHARRGDRGRRRERPRRLQGHGGACRQPPAPRGRPCRVRSKPRWRWEDWWPLLRSSGCAPWLSSSARDRRPSFARRAWAGGEAVPARQAPLDAPDRSRAAASLLGATTG